jgi:uncharacterized protein YhaN
VGRSQMNDELLSKIVLIVEICSPIFTGLTILYFRLSSRIDRAEAKSDGRVDSLRKEIKDEMQGLDHKMEQKFRDVEQRFVHMEQKLDHMDQKFEQKFERIDQKFEKIDQKFDRLFEMLVIRSQFGRGNPIKKTK